jgi:hypothetical protein
LGLVRCTPMTMLGAAECKATFLQWKNLKEKNSNLSHEHLLFIEYSRW